MQEYIRKRGPRGMSLHVGYDCNGETNGRRFLV